jgi:hypothetical protein
LSINEEAFSRLQVGRMKLRIKFAARANKLVEASKCPPNQPVAQKKRRGLPVEEGEVGPAEDVADDQSD